MYRFTVTDIPPSPPNTLLHTPVPVYMGRVFVPADSWLSRLSASQVCMLLNETEYVGILPMHDGMLDGEKVFAYDNFHLAQQGAPIPRILFEQMTELMAYCLYVLEQTAQEMANVEICEGCEQTQENCRC